jgi:hypothetical protein
VGKRLPSQTLSQSWAAQHGIRFYSLGIDHIRKKMALELSTRIVSLNRDHILKAAVPKLIPESSSSGIDRATGRDTALLSLGFLFQLESFLATYSSFELQDNLTNRQYMAVCVLILHKCCVDFIRYGPRL